MLPGASKLNLAASGSDLENDNLEDIFTMPKGTKLSASPFDYVNVQNAESFVGLTLSKDGESVEVCQLLKRSRITLEAMRKLIHGLCRDFAKLRKSANLRK